MHTLYARLGISLGAVYAARPKLRQLSLVLVLCCVLVPAWGPAPVQAEDPVTIDGPPIPHAPDIPSQTEIGFSEPVPPEAEKDKEEYAFFKDAETTLQLRNYYLNRDTLSDDKYETWAQGGWLGFKTGRIWDIMSFGITVYGSYGLYTPEDKDGAGLLAPGQENITVLGELYAKFNYARHELKLGRQEYNLPYLNRQDIRMIPNTFEAYSLAAPAAENPNFQYGVGYVDKMKKRNSDTFIPMSEAAGVPDTTWGAYAGGGRYTFAEAFTLEAFDVYTQDILNIFYAEVVSKFETDGGVGFKLAAQFTQENSVGDELLERASDSTYAFGGKADISYNNAVLTLVLTGNSSSEDLISPYGTYAGYNSIIINDYNRAGEYGLRTGLSYDFAGLGLKGLSAFGNYVWGFNAVDPETGNDIPNQDELDLTLNYKFKDSWADGLSIRLRGAFINEEGGNSLQDYRVIVNYPI